MSDSFNSFRSIKADQNAFNRVIICSGSGGVGKTTISAAIGYMFANDGYNVCVITIDPAKRLAQALGLDSLSTEPQKLELNLKGDFYSMMLDSQATFDSLIMRYAKNQEQARMILNNRIYKSLTGSLGGTQEYMASEKLYELASDKRFDVVVVDTPPARNALEFLESPTRLARFLENRVIRLLLLPSRSYFKAVNFATQSLIKSVSKAIGADLIGDAIDFFRAFEGMEEGFRHRAREMERFFRSQNCQFYLVCAPKKETILEAQYFRQALGFLGIEISKVIVNKVLADFNESQLSFTEAILPENSEVVDEKLAKEILSDLIAKFEALRKREEQNINQLLQELPAQKLIRVPMLSEDVHSIKTLASLAVKISTQLK